MDNPMVTVITPSYNSGKYLTETMDSVLCQLYSPIQYIVLNDGSKDGTTRVLRNFIDMGVIIINQGNQGEQKTVNKALQMVKGKYFMIVNADDPLYECIDTLVEFMESHPDVLCAYPDWYVIDENSEIVYEVNTREYDYAWMVRHHTCIPSVGAIFRSDLIQTVGVRDTSFRWLGDFDYWLRLGLAGKMARVSQPLATWRRHDGQASKQRDDKRAAEHVRVIRKLYSRSNLPMELIYGQSEAMCWAHLVAGSVSGSYRTALKYFIRGICWHPRVLIEIQTYHMVAQRLIHARRKG